MRKNFKVILFIESSRVSGRDYLRGIARYARLHASWSFYWNPVASLTNEVFTINPADPTVFYRLRQP